MKRIIWAPVAMSLALHIGCGGGASNNTPEAGTASATSNSMSAPTPKASVAGQSVAGAASTGMANSAAAGSIQIPEDPKEIIRTLLDGMRSGNGANLEQLFSSAARAEFEKQGIGLSPIGSPEAAFEVLDATMQNEAMIVSSKLFEPTQANADEATEIEILWELRKETSGWRISAMAVDQGDGNPVHVVNFENMSEEMNPAANPQAVAQPESRVASVPSAGVGANAAPALPNMPALPPAGQPSVQQQAAPGSLPTLPPANQLR